MDTDVCIHILRGNQTVLTRRQQHTDEVAVSFMTQAELFYGAEKSANPGRNLIAVEHFLVTVHIIQSTDAIMRRFGQRKAKLETAGNTLPDADLLIAATAAQHCRFLVTGNTKRFARFEGLALQNWLE